MELLSSLTTSSVPPLSCVAVSVTSLQLRCVTDMFPRVYVRDCILQPIPKPGKDASSSDNYRAIALAPTLSKVFERCILIQFHTVFTTSSLQFGFEPGVSTDLCTGLIKNVVASYCHRNSPVYGCFLDASKAFDRVDYSLLFKELLQRNLPPVQ